MEANMQKNMLEQANSEFKVEIKEMVGQISQLEVENKDK